MKRFCYLVILLILSSLAARAQESDPITIRFQVQPAHAEIVVLGSAEQNEREEPRAEPASSPILIPRKLVESGDLQVEIRAEGYQTTLKTFSVISAVKNKASEVTLPPIELKPQPVSPAALATGALVLVTLAAVGWRFLRKKTGTIEAWVAENTVPSDEHDEFLGKLLKDYWLVERLGQGGMATVYRATKDREEMLAIKLVHPHVASSPEFPTRFRREVTIGSELVHPNIVTVHEAGLEGGRYFIALEYVEGKDLRSVMKDDGLPLGEAKKYLIPVFEAVSFAHEKGIIHRDLKPDNVLVTKEGKVKLSDFGLARSHNFSTVTATGSIMGTPGYMAPELIQGQGLQAASDQYALGVLAYEVLTGRLPFDGDDPMAIIMQHLTAPPPPAHSLRTELNAQVDEFLQRMLAKDPEARFADVRAACQALQALA